MKAVLKETEITVAVSDSEFVEFMVENSEMSKNEAEQLIEESNIAPEYGGVIKYYNRQYAENEKEEWDEEDTERYIWVKNFFDAHPWIYGFVIYSEGTW